jgi:hypothetical protein
MVANRLPNFNEQRKKTKDRSSSPKKIGKSADFSFQVKSRTGPNSIQTAIPDCTAD